MSAERMAGERLAADDGEHADHGGGDGDDGADGERDVHRAAAEEPGLEEVLIRCPTDQLAILASSAAAAGSAVPSAAATTRTRPCTRITSTWLAVQAGLRTSGWTTSSVRPDRDRPAGHVDDPVHHRHQRVHVVRGEQHRDPLLAGPAGPSTETIPCSLEMSRLASGSSSSSSLGRLIRACAIMHPLLLAAGQLADPRVGVPLRADRGRACRLTSSRRAREGSRKPSLLPVEAERRPRP